MLEFVVRNLIGTLFLPCIQCFLGDPLLGANDPRFVAAATDLSTHSSYVYYA